ncbi:hypothetical protein GE061_004177 [Apolygus lucorum]|uniref:Uncharacterized protein n=1 Tax=Apolygus lucorum TaxID=248454 RepID=A0A8S9WYG6_APOLU|nr:hypothetical protein GE061_004177 [Apolygus lucorum]
MIPLKIILLLNWCSSLLRSALPVRGEYITQLGRRSAVTWSECVPVRANMTSLLKIGLMLMAVTLLLVLVHPADADEDVKRKRVIIKVPHRVKHIYHHHTKKVHVSKKKPKPKPKKKKPHKHVHVVVEEEEIVQPIKSWKTIHSPFKKGKSMGWGDWNASPSGFKQTVRHPDDFSFGRESSHHEEDFVFEDDHDARESRPYGRPHNRGSSNSSGGGGGGKRTRKGSRGNSYRNHEDPSFEASYEVYHHYDDEDYDGDRPRRKPKSKMSGVPRPNGRGGPPNRSNYGRTTRRPRVEEKYREPDEYDELYERGPAYPEHKEHPSWHDRSRNYADQTESGGLASNQNIWNLPKVPEVKEYIDDVNDTPDPGVRFQNGGGFYPSAYNPITTITASVVENPPAIPPAVHEYPANPPFPDFPANNGFNNFRPPSPQQRPVVPTLQPQQPSRPTKNNKFNKKHKKNPGYLSQVSQTSEGLTVGYQSHVGHSSDIESPSSSFQSVSYGNTKK